MRALARLARRGARPRRARAQAGGGFVVLWWPCAGDPVPQAAGPYTEQDARAVRDALRARQCREQNMAQAVPLAGGLVVHR
ncbi:hypothetical protein [Cellulosimicrobium sp. Marseille-Q4280]|uniref:hypothetical protein n=1 Tax=Cellulosimicrobium sp. Marseille-Q4280 TaxID=2937992 RepID=UPI00203B128F|nr:hypothetical protein [Cellulosimicrobium sp. Marseille-Q4280]